MNYLQGWRKICTVCIIAASEKRSKECELDVVIQQLKIVYIDRRLTDLKNMKDVAKISVIILKMVTDECGGYQIIIKFKHELEAVDGKCEQDRMNYNVWLNCQQEQTELLQSHVNNFEHTKMQGVFTSALNEHRWDVARDVDH